MTALAFAPAVPEAPPASLSQRAMTVALHLRMWQGQQLDADTTREVLTERSAEKDAGKFIKYLVPKDALKGVTKAHTQARQAHNKLTLPWGEDGVRIMSSAVFFDYTNAMHEHRMACGTEYQAFLAKFPQFRAEAPTRLGARLFKEVDFPTVEEVKAKFQFDIEIMPVPEAGDFRVALGRDVEDSLRKSIECTVTDRAAEAQHTLWQDVFKTLKHFATTMADTKDDGKAKIFRDTTLTNLAELAARAPKLSLKADPKLEELCGEIVKLTGTHSAEELRRNPVARTAAAVRAKRTLEEVEDAMRGAF